jgi:hypothetical protein
MLRDIGFNHDAPENTDSVREAWTNDRSFTCRKTRQKGGVFLYSCERKFGGTESVTRLFSDRNQTPEELEALPQFVAFVSATMRGLRSRPETLHNALVIGFGALFSISGDAVPASPETKAKKNRLSAVKA